MEIITKYIAQKGTVSPKIQAKVVTGQKVVVEYDLSLEQEKRHRIAAEKLFEKLKKNAAILETCTLHLVNNKTQHSGYTYTIRQVE